MKWSWHPTAVRQLNISYLHRVVRSHFSYSGFDDYLLFFAVPCSVGSYFDKETKICVPCAVGSYQSESGQMQCSVCPAIAGRQGVTVSTGARSASQCKERCPAGKYYDDEAGLCRSCGYGFYQPSEGSFKCLLCGLGKTTRTTEAVSQEVRTVIVIDINYIGLLAHLFNPLSRYILFAGMQRRVCRRYALGHRRRMRTMSKRNVQDPRC